jgi:hypothetical protein
MSKRLSVPGCAHRLTLWRHAATSFFVLAPWIPPRLRLPFTLFWAILSRAAERTHSQRDLTAREPSPAVGQSLERVVKQLDVQDATQREPRVAKWRFHSGRVRCPFPWSCSERADPAAQLAQPVNNLLIQVNLRDEQNDAPCRSLRGPLRRPPGSASLRRCVAWVDRQAEH